jgi:hypothetical protein
MNQLKQQDVELHVTILGWLHLVGAALFLLMAVFVLVLLTGIGLATREAEAVRVLTVVGTLIGFLLLILGLPGLAAGYGLLTHRPWSRVLAIVLGIFNLMNIPLGTLIGIYTIWVLLQEKAANYFAPLRPA